MIISMFPLKQSRFSWFFLSPFLSSFFVWRTLYWQENSSLGNQALFSLSLTSHSHHLQWAAVAERKQLYGHRISNQFDMFRTTTSQNQSFLTRTINPWSARSSASETDSSASPGMFWDTLPAIFSFHSLWSLDSSGFPSKSYGWVILAFFALLTHSHPAHSYHFPFSSMVLRYTQDDFNENYSVTIGAAFATKTLQLKVDDDQIVNLKYVSLPVPLRSSLHIWDTAGEEQYRSMTRFFYREALVGTICVHSSRSPVSRYCDLRCHQRRSRNHQESQVLDRRSDQSVPRCRRVHRRQQDRWHGGCRQRGNQEVCCRERLLLRRVFCQDWREHPQPLRRGRLCRLPAKDWWQQEGGGGLHFALRILMKFYVS